jgi:hypothetical protein
VGKKYDERTDKLYQSPDIERVITSWARHAARIGEMRYTRKFLSEKKRSCECGIKIDS